MPAPSELALVDRVDLADRTEGTIQRGQVFQMGAGFRVVHVFVFDQQGRILLQQLGKNRQRNPLKWGSSVAGYLNAGESDVDAATRRLEEELGLVTPLEKHGSISMQDLNSVKFITLYKTVSDHAAIREPDHIKAISFWTPEDVEAAFQSEPEQFTETFRYVFRFYRATDKLKA